jgi:hypothetical protein
VSLNELEVIRSDIVKQFQETLTDTQSKIDLIIKELNIQPIEPVIQEEPKPRPKPQPQPQQVEPEVDEEGTPRRGRETVEERLDKLKQDVLKELEELDRLELEQ